MILIFLISEAFAYRLKDEDVIVVGGVITSCIYDISTKGNVIEIPEILDGQTVTGIGDYAFSVAGKIAVLTLPSTIKTIGNGVFEGHALTSLDIPKGVTSIGYRAFYGNALASINLPVGLESIADESFANNQLTGVVLPDGLKTIGWGAFQNNKITSLNIPNSVETIGIQAFYNNKISVLNFQPVCKLKEIPSWCFSNNEIKTLNVPNSILNIGECAFQSNSNLTSVVFGNNLLKIRRGAFNSCNLSSVSLPESLVFLGKYVFEGNINLNSIKLPVSANNYKWNDSNGDKHNGGEVLTNKYYSYVAIIPYTLKDNDVEVLNGVITNCTYFNDITHIGSVITIPDKLDGQDIVGIGMSNGSGSFQDRGISEIILPNNVKNIDNWAFYGNEIINVTLPNSLVKIGDYVFYNNCINSVSFESTSSLEVIGIEAFGSNRLTKIDFPISVVKIEKFAFRYNSLLNISFELNSKLLSIGSGAFVGNNELLSFKLPDPKINSYDHWVDWDNKKYSTNLVVDNFESFYKIPVEYTLTDADVVVTDGVIVSCTFSNPDANILTIPEVLDGQKITGIGNGVFRTFGLIGVNLPSTLRLIDYGAFADNDIVNVTIPANIVKIENDAFFRNNISELLFEEKSRLKEIGWSAFYNNKITKLTLPDSVNYIGGYAFSYNKISNGIIIPDSVKRIDWGAFSGNQIPSVIFGKNSVLSYLGIYAFSDNVISNEIFIPKTLTEISDYAFQNNNISKVILHEGIVDYGNGAFLNNNPSLKIVLHKPPTIPLVTHFFWWKDNNDSHFMPGETITDYSKRYKAVIDQFFIVKFIVKDDNNSPVGNASIQFYENNMITDLNGIDSIGPVYRGLQNYKVSAAGCYDLAGNVDVQDNMTVLVTLVRYYKVNIKILDVNNNPISGAKVIINGTEFNSGMSGNVNTNLTDGEYAFKVNATGFNELGSTLTVLDADNTVTVKLINININYLPNGGTGASYTETANGTVYVTNNNPFTRNAYIFTHWNSEADNTGKDFGEKESISLQYSNIDLYAIWKPVDYNIIYHLDGGSNATSNPKTYNIESEINLLPASKPSLYFATWLDSDSNRVNKIEKGKTGDIELWAIFTSEPTYFIDYHNVENASHNNQSIYTKFDLPMSLTAANKRGYEFTGWYEDALFVKKITMIPGGSVKNYDVYAKWGKPFEYSIIYNLEGGINHPSNPAKYTIESYNILFETPTKTGATFVAWYSNKELTKKINDIPHGSIGDTTIYAKWELDTFDIKYELNGGNNHPLNPSIYTIESSTISLETPSKTGAAFVAWFSNMELTMKITEIPKGSTGDKTIYAKWELDTFDIQYVLNGGNNNPSNPAGYTIESNTIVFEKPAKTGAAFVDWYSDKELTKKITEIPHGSTGDALVYAKWDLEIFDIQYVLDGGNNNPNNPAKYTVESKAIYFESPSKTGAAFVGWFADKELTKKITNIPAGSIGNATVYAKWELNGFEIHYILNGGINHPDNPLYYTIASSSFNFESPSKTGATFVAWYSDKELTKKISGIPTGSIGDTTIYSKWDLVDFNINYVLDGGINHPGNPANYTVESNTFKLESATKTGAEFVGWFSNKERTKEITDIPTGSTGDTTIYAKWKLDVFEIKYELNGGKNHQANPANYNIESDRIVFEKPTKPGAAFVSWYGNKELTKKISEIPHGSLGDTIIYAKWELDTFDIEYVLSGGNNHPANPNKYTIESNKIIFESPLKTGAKFISWYSDKELTRKITDIPVGSIGDTTIYAKWELDIYDIHYELNGGINNSSNPVQYTIDSEKLVFEPPTKIGASFIAWYGDKNFNYEIVGIPKGTIGDTTIFAKWELDTFDIEYVLTGGLNNVANPAIYTIESGTINFENPERVGFVFDGWFLSSDYSDSISSIPKGSVGNLTLYAKWLEIFKVNFIITTDGKNPAQNVDVVINKTYRQKSDSLGLADTLVPDESSIEYSIEINHIVIEYGSATVSGNDITIKVEIIDCYLRWYDVIFCDNGKGLWKDFVWYKDNIWISDEQFFHNPGGIQEGKYRLTAISVAGIEYTWEKEYTTYDSQKKSSETGNYEMTVFPNPVTKGSNLNIVLSEDINLQTARIFIYSVNGTLNKIISNPLYTNEIIIDGKFSPGLYQVVFLDDKNNGRIIKAFTVY